MTTSPRVIGVELRHRFDPPQRLALVFRVQSRDRSGDPAANLLRARVRHDKAQFAQPLPAPAIPHRSHSLGRCCHIALPVAAPDYVTRYAPGTSLAHTVASALAGEPTAPGRRKGGAVNRKRERP